MTNPPLRDSLTGLGSRHAFLQTLEGSLRFCGRVALLLCDVDRFKVWNDAFGHKRGDRELRRIARDLKQICAPFQVFRFGGDEFVIVLHEHSIEQAREVAAQILASQVPRVVLVNGAPVEAMSFSIGFALFPDHALDAEKLLAAADVALMKLKGQGGPRGPLLPDGTPLPRGNRALAWGDFLDEFPDQSAGFLNPDFLPPSV